MKMIFLPALCLFLHPLSFSQNRYDIVINELMADPVPVTGLPSYEWLELKNRSTTAINLLNWRIGDATTQSGSMPGFILQPDSFVIVCSNAALAALSAFGTCIPVSSFPSLDNDDDQLYLKSANGMIIHSLAYTTEWYRNELKKDGGWSLEMIDPSSPCTGAMNWKASVDPAGGTPGKKNAVDAINPDDQPPRLLRSYTTDSVTIVLVFDETLDSVSAATPNNYQLDPSLPVIIVTTVPPLFDRVQIKTGQPLLMDSIYKIYANNIHDCNQNNIQPGAMVKTGLAVEAKAGEFIINEILFDPKSGGYDYAEFLNNSGHIFDASRLYIANRNSSGVPASIKPLYLSPYLVFPGDHLAVTESASNLPLHYFVRNPENILQLASVPSFPDDEGIVLSMNSQGDVLDELHYRDDWHFKLIDNREGISLERIDPKAETQSATNWHSAASAAGFGTPGYRNSQYRVDGNYTDLFQVTPRLFSPDNDGRDDFTAICYELTEPGYVANVRIYDIAGRMVRFLVHNATMGIKGCWNWDGLGENGLQLPVGTYIIFGEIFNLAGRKNSFKKLIVLARKLN
jgi:hypothetical protein